MSATLKITLTPEAQKIVAGLQTLPPRVINYIAAAMDQANQLAISRIQRDHLTGRGPFPVEDHKLGVVTNRLRASVTASKSTVSGDVVDSSIGSNVKYAAIHEFGGRIHRQARKQTIRLRTDKRGALIRQLGHPQLAVFARSSHKSARTSVVDVAAHDIEMPERAPFRTGIQESAGDYRKSISAGIVAAWSSLGNS